MHQFLFSRVQKFHWILKIRPDQPYFGAEGFSRIRILDIVKNVSETRGTRPYVPCDVVHLRYKKPLVLILITVPMLLVLILTTYPWSYLILRLAYI